jgi:hypothetical protein
MIDVLFEQHVIQNTGLAAETIWYAVNETYNSKRRAEGVPLALVFLVLPLAFHERTPPCLLRKLSRARFIKQWGRTAR